MRRNLFSGLLAAAMLLALASCGLQGTASGPDPTPIPTAENTSFPERTTPTEDAPHQAGKVLVAYFSATGNTRPLAEGAQWIAGSRFSAGTSRDAMVEWVNSLGLDLTAE